MSERCVGCKEDLHHKITMGGCDKCDEGNGPFCWGCYRTHQENHIEKDEITALAQRLEDIAACALGDDWCDGEVSPSNLFVEYPEEWVNFVSGISNRLNVNGIVALEAISICDTWTAAATWLHEQKG